MSIIERLEALRAGAGPGDLRSDGLRQEMRAALADEERRRPLRVGDVAPAFDLADGEGRLVSSLRLLDAGRILVTFYRGLWCPCCRQDLDGLQDAMLELRAVGASAIAISQDLSAAAAARSMVPDVQILDDRKGDVAVGFGIRWSVSELERIAGYLDDDLAIFRDSEPWIVPMQARFVLDRDGTVLFSEIAYNYDQRTEPLALVTLCRDGSAARRDMTGADAASRGLFKNS